MSGRSADTYRAGAGGRIRNRNWLKGALRAGAGGRNCNSNRSGGHASGRLRAGQAGATAVVRGIHFRPAQAGATTIATVSKGTLCRAGSGGRNRERNRSGDTCQARAATNTARARLRRDAAVGSHPVHAFE